jgi:uncharacterized protein YutE (UPF0331/DUF86 family)
VVDVDVVARKLAELSLRLARIRAQSPEDSASFESNQDAFELASFNLLLAVQSCLDIASHLIADEGWEPPATLGEAFLRLQDHGVLTPETARAMKQAAGMRNLLAHGYETVDPEQLQEAAVQGVADLESFSREVAAWTAGRLDR